MYNYFIRYLLHCGHEDIFYSQLVCLELKCVNSIVLCGQITDYYYFGANADLVSTCCLYIHYSLSCHQ